ncbi:hypothetical protein P9112_004953 [Eukaryota sp. TZLM1-RC]
MTDTHSVSRVFTRSCALNSLLTPAAVQQIRTDLPLVTEICHEASLLLQSFLLNFPLASRALVEQDVWYLFMTVITINFNLNNSRERFFLLNACRFILNLLQRFPTTASLLSSHDKITFSSKEISELFLFNLKISQYLLTFFSHMHCWKKFRIIPLASHKGSKFIEVPSQIFHFVKKFPIIEGLSSKTKFIRNTCLKRVFKQCPYQKFNINRKSLKNRFKKILLKTNGNELLLTFEGKNNDSENTDELDEPPKKKRRSKNEMKSDPDANKTRETQLKGTKKMPRRRRRHPVEILPERPLIGVDLGQSRLCGYFLDDNQCGVIPCPTGRRYRTNPSPSKHSPNQYSVQNFNQYLNHWNLVRRKVYLESNRQKWKIIKFDNRRRKERRFRETLNKFQRLAGHPEKLYLAVGSANFPSHCRKVNRYGSARAFRKWLCYQKDVKHLSTSEFNTSKMSSCCMAENIQAGSWQMRICTECQIVYDRDISAAKNIQIKKKAELWPERYICPDALLRR